MEKLEIKTSIGDMEEVRVEISSYQSNGGIHISLTSLGGELAETSNDVTVDLGGSAIDYGGYLDTVKFPELESFITENGIGEYTGFSRRSGLHEYPFYVFNSKRLQELCEEDVTQYEQSLKRKEEAEEKQRAGR